MDRTEILNKILEDQEAIALATTTDNNANVRIVNYIMAKGKPGLLYFATFKGNTKEKEFIINDRVAFTTIPNHNTAHVKVNRCKVIKSKLSIKELAHDFILKLPEYKQIIDKAAELLVVYELHFNCAKVTLDFENIYDLQL